MRESLARTEWVGFTTIVIREFNRIIRIWGQTIVPPVVTADSVLRDFRQPHRQARRDRSAVTGTCSSSRPASS